MLRTIGTSTHIPKNPYTTEGIPAIRFINGFITLYKLSGQNFARYIAVRSPIGTPMISAPAVTYILPNIKGRMPKYPFVGFHTSPRVKSPKPISLIAGIPFTNRNTHMSATAAMDTNAAIMNTTCIIISLNLCIS